jgi:hypothetical protein
MNTEVSIKILMNESSSEEEVKLIKEEIATFLYKKGLAPTSILCRSGSTELIIQFVLEQMAKGVLSAIGGLFFSFVYKEMSKNKANQDSENRIEESKKDYIKNVGELMPTEADIELPEILIDKELSTLLQVIDRSSDATYTLSVAKDDGLIQTVTEHTIEVSNGKLKKFGKSENQYFK